MLKRVMSLVEYIAWLHTKTNEIHLQQKNAFRIIEITKNKKNENILHIQIINKTTIFYCTPIEIAAHDSLLESFSKKDIRTITYLATKEIHQPKRQIISHSFNEKLKKYY